MKEKIFYLKKDDTGFPALLREIPLPPKGLYIIGAAVGVEPKVAIVGTRNASPQGLAVARRFAYELARAGVTIVSGLALGIDSAAHQGALDAGGRTIAVLGRGLREIYPKQNEKLAEKILAAGGSIISEYEPDETARGHQFIERNRLVSGLCLGILAVEAPQRSGTLSTARFAVEQNRDVFVIPGAIGNPNYAGSNALIKSGAALVTEPRDILEPLGLWKEPEAMRGSPLGSASLNKNQKIILAVLGKNHQPMHTDEIIAKTKLTEVEVNQELAMLVITGIIKETAGTYHI